LRASDAQRTVVAMRERRRVMTAIKRARIMAGMSSQQELANRVCAARTTITSIENGASIPSVTLALAIARELDTTVEALWGRLLIGD
jgi:DNA-binding XRE family transcriptional regulator